MSRRASGNNPSVKLSKALSWLLRHGAEKEGFKFLPGGFLYVDSILQKPQFKSYTMDEVKAVVASNEKQRFHLETDEETGRLKIRANQGHTLEVTDLALQPLTSADQIPVVVHGTYFRCWESIRRQGLRRMARNHVHFAAGEPGQAGVISGMRGSCDVIIYLDLEKAIAGGLKFFRSANNVILCEGNEDGIISTQYFKRVINRKTGAELDLAHPVSDTRANEEPGGAVPKKGIPLLVPESADDIAHEVDQQRKQRSKRTLVPRH
ncbi:tRNA 2'-phosphotransferase 1-like [Babylonia areolata]|uniref:tRNA 2'-phosphotransferase 1-like n=1 Tax=Babylonia areolata TaxID=304850 RepID=UPI003FD2C903